MKRQRIAIIGAGGMAREVASALQWINKTEDSFDFLGYLVSDTSRLGPRDSSDQVIGSFDWLERHGDDIDALAMGVGSPALRLKLAAELKSRFGQLEWPVLIHPTAVIDLDSAHLGEGCFIGARVTATVNITLEPFALCNFASTLGHEAHIGRGSVISPGANVNGGVIIGDGVLIGSGAQILQYLQVGAGASVGAGAVVNKDVEPGATVVGIPAKPINKRRPAEPPVAAPQSIP
ncbi:MAG TPA: NeuD/PglB/VioB family sugar acetyltransferase [Terriglobales bacterium]|jgi:sugar O-acyltransferase (sialic acid O-acetyltransferase NeuD family)